MLVVLDTNVIVSGLLNGNGTPGKIMDLLLEGHFQVAYDDRILGEYEDVLVRPELRILPAKARIIIDYIELSGQFIDPEKIEADGYPDHGDLPFVEVFISANAQALVTGNLRHFSPLVNRGAGVYSPALFLDKFFPSA